MSVDKYKELKSKHGLKQSAEVNVMGKNKKCCQFGRQMKVRTIVKEL